MSGSIYVIQPDKSLSALQQEKYRDEDHLQKYLSEYPDLLAGDQMDEIAPRRWLLVSREMGVPSEEAGPDQWSVDHLFLDQDGIPTLVEVKRRGDTRIRREVVGQMLDYAANAVVYWPVQKIQECLTATCEAQQQDPTVKIAKQLLGKDEPDPASIETFWEQVKTNLQANRIRLVFVADEVPPELRQIVEFLSRNMNPVEVFAVEIHQYVNGDLKTLVPRVIGQRRRQPPSPSTPSWDETSFFSRLETSNRPETVLLARALYSWSQDRFFVRWGKGKLNGAFSVFARTDDREVKLFSLYNWISDSTTGALLEVSGTNIHGLGPFQKDEAWSHFCKRLNQIWPRRLPNSPADVKQPQVPLCEFAEKDRLQGFLDLMDWVTQQIGHC